MRWPLVDVPRRAIAIVCTLLAIAATSIAVVSIDLTAPAAARMSAPSGEFSAARAVADLRTFATGPHPIGSRASDELRDRLAARLRFLGARVRIDHGVGGFAARGTAHFGRVDNVVAAFPGRDPTGTVLLAAHYDSVAAGPGASDDVAAVAAILETVRALREHGSLRNDLVVLLTDGEEPGLLGASAFVRQDPWGRRGGVVLNYEARGTSGPSLMFETSANDARLVETFAKVAPQPYGDSSLAEAYRAMHANNTDFSVFREHGFLGLNFAYMNGSARYHTPQDSLAHVDARSVQSHGTNMLALTIALGRTDLTRLHAAHNETYFRVFGTLITYPDGLVLPIAVLALLAVLALGALARRRRLASIPRILVGFASAALPPALSAALAQGLWILLTDLRPGYADMLVGDTYRPGMYRLAVVAIAVAVVLAWYAVLRRRIGAAALAIGSLAWPALFGLGLAQVAPGAAFPYSLPAAGAAIAGVTVLVLRPRWLRAAALVLGGLPATALLVHEAGTAFAGMGTALAGVPAVMLAVYLLILLPELEWAYPRTDQARGTGRRGWVPPVVAAALAVGLIASGLAGDRFDAQHPRPSYLAYILNTDTHQAQWISTDMTPSTWTRRYVTTKERSVILPVRPDTTRSWTGRATAISAAAPTAHVLSTAGDAIRLHVVSARSAPAIRLVFNRPVTAATATVRGRPSIHIPIRGRRPGSWPSEIRFDDLPASGADVTVSVPNRAGLAVAIVDETPALDGVSGFRPRPPGLDRSAWSGSDAVFVGHVQRL